MSAAAPRIARFGHGSRADRFSVDAIVRAVGADGCVAVELSPTARCAGCAGACMWMRSDAPRPATLACGHASLRSGDPVRVYLPTKRLLQGTLVLHGLPLASLLLGAAIGAFATQSDLGCLLGAVTGIGLMLAATPRLTREVERLTLERVSVEPLP